MLRVLCIFLSACYLLVGCTHTEYVTKTNTVVLIPHKQVVPQAPALQKYDVRYGLDHPANFRKFQENQLRTSDYIINLRSALRGYEDEITRMEAKKAELEQMK